MEQSAPPRTIAWILMGLGVYSLVTTTMSMGDQNFVELMMIASTLPASAQIALAYIGSVLSIAGGILILKGQPYGRLLYVGWWVLRLSVDFATSLAHPMMILPGLVQNLIVTFFLFRRGKKLVDKSEKVPLTVRRVVSIALTAVGSSFFSAQILVGFVEGLPLDLETYAFLFGVGLGAIAVLTGQAVNRYANWKWDVGVSLATAAALPALTLLTFYTGANDPHLKKFVDPDAFTLFSNYVTGGARLIGFAACGALLMKLGRKSVSGLRVAVLP